MGSQGQWLDLSFLTDAERKLVIQVLERDEALRTKEQERVRSVLYVGKCSFNNYRILLFVGFKFNFLPTSYITIFSHSRLNFIALFFRSYCSLTILCQAVLIFYVQFIF